MRKQRGSSIESHFRLLRVFGNRRLQRKIPGLRELSLLIGQMIVPGSTYWNLGYGLDPGEVEKDEEGIKTMKDLGVNMAWLLKQLQD